MVRLKNRYLLVHILYPPPPSSSPPGGQTAASASSGSKSTLDPETQFHLQLCRPTTDSLTSAALARMIRDAVGEMYGDWGMGKLGGAGAGSVIVKYFSPATSTAIIRCPRASYRLVWSALTYSSRLPDLKGGRPHRSEGGRSVQQQQRECVFRVVRVSGTMKKAEQEAIKRARMEVVRAMRVGEEGGAEVLNGMFGADAGEDIELEDAPEQNEVEDESESDSEG